MRLIAASTIYGMFSCFLLFWLLGLPAWMRWTAMTLLTAEIVALGMWSYGSRGCDQRPCATVAEAGRTAATVDVPLLGVSLVAIAAFHVARAVRNERLMLPERDRDRV